MTFRRICPLLAFLFSSVVHPALRAVSNNRHRLPRPARSAKRLLHSPLVSREDGGADVCRWCLPKGANFLRIWMSAPPLSLAALVMWHRKVPESLRRFCCWNISDLWTRLTAVLSALWDVRAFSSGQLCSRNYTPKTTGRIKVIFFWLFSFTFAWSVPVLSSSSQFL